MYLLHPAVILADLWQTRVPPYFTVSYAVCVCVECLRVRLLDSVKDISVCLDVSAAPSVSLNISYKTISKPGLNVSRTEF